MLASCSRCRKCVRLRVASAFGLTISVSATIFWYTRSCMNRQLQRRVCTLPTFALVLGSPSMREWTFGGLDLNRIFGSACCSVLRYLESGDRCSLGGFLSIPENPSLHATAALRMIIPNLTKITYAMWMGVKFTRKYTHRIGFTNPATNNRPKPRGSDFES